MGFIDWIQNNWYAVAEAAGGLVVAAGVIVGFFNGPKADRAKTVLDRILGLLRQIGVGTYKDEPGTFSVPLKPDSGVRVETTTTA
jgi:hypothetical protein